VALARVVYSIAMLFGAAALCPMMRARLPHIAPLRLASGLVVTEQRLHNLTNERVISYLDSAVQRLNHGDWPTGKSAWASTTPTKRPGQTLRQCRAGSVGPAFSFSLPDCGSGC
jgi:hypothetical protein